jgi:V/A-type H+/Na+-transporting ATPase subunit F
MSDQAGIAIIGARDSILGFRALGLDVYPVTSSAEAQEAFDECVRRGYAAVFITEGSVPELRERMKSVAVQATPAVVIIPEGQESRGLGLAQLRSIVEKAIGADILFRGEARE